jgi:S-adenosylmethionine synthetase
VSILVSELDGTTPSALPVEVVERKGLGHPDTICDALVEEVSRALSCFYLKHFGFILHHNVDKVLLRGGSAKCVDDGQSTSVMVTSHSREWRRLSLHAAGNPSARLYR